jgi:exosortase
MKGRPQAAVWAVFAILLIANYFPTLKWMIARWDEADSYMAHGWLIPPISAFLLWQERARLRLAFASGSVPGSKSVFGSATLWGFLFICVGLAFHLVAGMADVSSISGITLVLVLYGFVVLRFGWPMARLAWFPILFLLFMVPPPEFVISKMNFSLKLLASDLATALLNLIGLPAIRQGSYMIFGDEKLAVGDVCSGLRSLLALLSLGVLYAWMIRDKGKAHVWAVLLMAIPAAIVGNGIRIFLVSLLVIWLGQEAVFRSIIGTWDLHLFTGAIIFAAAFCCLWLVSLILDKAMPRKPAFRSSPEKVEKVPHDR